MTLRRKGAGALLAAGATAAFAGARLLHNWGSTPLERNRQFPGDELVPDPATTVTLAATVRAPANEVWHWLVQIGQDRAGMYSYDRLENLIGLRIHSANEIRDEWKHLDVGDRVVLVRKGWLGMKIGYSLPVAAIEEGRAIILRQAPPEHPWNAVWSFTIEPEGPDACRLVSRSRSERRSGFAGLTDTVLAGLLDPVTALMTRQMLLGIKRRAERQATGSMGQGESTAIRC